jgi:uncharacterized ion transporter superfamily protein YfcC
MKEGRAPDTYVIIFFVVLFAAALTYLIPAGSFETDTVRFTDAAGAVQEREVLVPESFQLLRDEEGRPVRRGIPVFAPGGEVGVFNYAFEGLVSGSKWGAAIGVVAFILLIGGAFGIVLRTGAIEAGILTVIKKTSGAEALLVPIMFFLFSLGGAVFGMGEEAIAFAMILVPMVLALGYDAVVGVLITYVATQVGFATSWMNPFSVAIAQGVAEIPVLSGAPFRMAMWAFFTLAAGGWTWWYAHRVRRDPTRSPLHGRPEPPGQGDGGGQGPGTVLRAGPQAGAPHRPGHGDLGHLGRHRKPVLHPRDRHSVLRHGGGGRHHRRRVQAERDGGERHRLLLPHRSPGHPGRRHHRGDGQGHRPGPGR